jgi:sarcosine oxidase delta subunit
MITCTRCNTTKPEEEFPLNGDGKGGRRKQCKECMRTINKEWRKENKTKVHDYNKGRKKLGG